MALMRLFNQRTLGLWLVFEKFAICPRCKAYGVIVSGKIKEKVQRQQSQLRQLGSIVARSYLNSPNAQRGGVDTFGTVKRRFHSSYASRLTRRSDELSDTAYLKELYHRDGPDAVIRVFESQPSLQSNPSAVAEYVKALVKVDRLDESELLKTLQRVPVLD